MAATGGIWAGILASDQIRPEAGFRGKRRGGPDGKDGRREPRVGAETASGGRTLGDRHNYVFLVSSRFTCLSL